MTQSIPSPLFGEMVGVRGQNNINKGSKAPPFCKGGNVRGIFSCHSETLPAAAHENSDCSESLFLYCWQDPEQLEK